MRNASPPQNEFSKMTSTEPYIGLEPINSSKRPSVTAQRNVRYTRTNAFPIPANNAHQVLEESFEDRMPISSLTTSRFQNSNYQRKTASDLRWELQSRDSHLGHVMKNERNA